MKESRVVSNDTDVVIKFIRKKDLGKIPLCLSSDPLSLCPFTCAHATHPRPRPHNEPAPPPPLLCNTLVVYLFTFLIPYFKNTIISLVSFLLLLLALLAVSHFYLSYHLSFSPFIIRFALQFFIFLTLEIIFLFYLLLVCLFMYLSLFIYTLICLVFLLR